MKRTESSGGVVINFKREILVVSQKGSSWSLPKGRIEKSEDKIQAAKREIYEESGIKKLEFIKELGSYKRHKMDKKNNDDKSELKTISIFLFKTNETNLKPIDKDNPEARWVKKDKVVKLLTHRKDKEFFLSILDKI